MSKDLRSIIDCNKREWQADNKCNKWGKSMFNKRQLNSQDNKSLMHVYTCEPFEAK